MSETRCSDRDAVGSAEAFDCGNSGQDGVVGGRIVVVCAWCCAGAKGLNISAEALFARVLMAPLNNDPAQQLLTPRLGRAGCRSLTQEVSQRGLKACSRHVGFGSTPFMMRSSSLDAMGLPVARGGAALAEVDSIDLTGLDPRLAGVEILVAVNPHNVLCGERGVARVFGPQKGATPEQVELLSAAMERWAKVLEPDDRGGAT
jgi:hypothetical protein